MFGTHDLALFAITVFVLNATPGVDLMFTLTRTLQHGKRGGVAAALGISAGCVSHALAAAFGLAALLATSAAAFNLLKWAGAAYLLWLAVGMLREALRAGASTAPTATAAATDVAGGVANPEAATGANAQSLAGLFRQGLLTNLLNPKIAVFFLALLPQFINADAPDKTLAPLFLGAWFVVQGTLFLVVFVWLVAPLARWTPPPLVRQGLNALGGALFAGLAARLALAQRA